MSCNATVANVLTIPGPAGQQGLKGDQGDPGIQGIQGIAGPAGVAGPAGANGVNGTNGVNAYTATTANFNQPGVGANVNVTVGNSSWAALGEPVFMETGGSYLVAGIPDATHLTLTNLGYAGNAAPAAVVVAGKVVTPSGFRGATGATPSALSYAQLLDQVVSGGASQVIGFGAWTTLRLQSSSPVVPNACLLSLVANQFVPAAGTYIINGALNAAQCFLRTRIANISVPGTFYAGIQTTQPNNSSSVVPYETTLIANGVDTYEWQYYAVNDGGAGVNQLGTPMAIVGDFELYKTLSFLKLA